MTKGFKVAPPFHADHVGSLLRPVELTSAHRFWREGMLSNDVVAEIMDKAIREVVGIQEQAGLESITDGEFRRALYWSHFVDAIEGMTVREALFVFRDDHDTLPFTAPDTTGKIRRKRPISVGEFSFLNAVTKRTAKITMPSPATMHFWLGRAGVDRRAYPDEDLFFKYIQLTNAPLEAVPAQLTVAMHLCRGNYKGKWLSEGGYGYVAERLFNEVAVDGYFPEYDTARAGDFAPLSFVPAQKVVVLGLISTKPPISNR